MTAAIHVATDALDSARAPIHVEVALFAAPKIRMFMIFAEAELRPPVYDEMVADMGHLINKVVSGYVDPSCVELHYEDLVADCWAKTSEMVAKGLIDRCRTREEYFKQYKTALRNHVCSLVQRHRFTEKRTGVKAPPKDQRNVFNTESTRPKEVRIDDPDCGFQVSSLDSGCDQADFSELVEHVSERLKRAERLVLEELISPSEETLALAQLDAETGRQDGEPLRIRIRHCHMAEAIGISASEFRACHDSVKKKCLFMKTHDEDDPRKTAAMATLLQFFGIQIPRRLDEITRKRALMLAAQHQYDRLKDNPAIQEAMGVCGIPVPEVRNERFKCYGIMFQKHHRSCVNCGLKEGCELKAANFGLGEITISHKLLGSRHARVPVIRPSRSANDVAFAETERDDEILAFVTENFKAVRHQGETCYRHKDRLKKCGMQLILSVGRQAAPLRLRFINPADEIKPSLVLESGEKGGRPSWYLPSALSAAEAINLIRTHAQMTFVKA